MSRVYRSQNDFGRFVREKREELGLTAEDIAQKMGVSKSWVDQIETQGGSHRPKTLEMLANALNCDVAELHGLNKKPDRRTRRASKVAQPTTKEPANQPQADTPADVPSIETITTAIKVADRVSEESLVFVVRQHVEDMNRIKAVFISYAWLVYEVRSAIPNFCTLTTRDTGKRNELYGGI